MMLPFQDINLTAVLIAAIISFAFGALWYSPILFIKTWMKLTNTKESDCKNAGKTMIYGFIINLIRTYILALVITIMNVTTVSEVMIIAILLWLAMSVPIETNGVLWERKPINLFWLNSIYFLITTWITASILVTWPW